MVSSQPRIGRQGLYLIAACALLMASFIPGPAPVTGITYQSDPAADTIPEYIRSSAGYTVVLRKGENVLETIRQLAVKEKITGASYTGFGFVEAEFGYFNNRTKAYDPKKVTGELASLTGSIAWNADTVSLHTHAVVTDSTFQAYGGHLLKAVVGTGSVELFVVPVSVPLGRKVEQPLGANVLQLPTASGVK